MIHVIGCPKCKRQYKIKGDPAGKQLKCPACQAVFMSSRSVQEKKPATPAPAGQQAVQAGPIAPLPGSPKLFPDQPVPPQAADPLANHVVGDPGFAHVDVDEIRRQKAEEAKKKSLDHAFSSTSALAKLKEESDDKKAKKKSPYLSGDVLFGFEGRVCRKTFWISSILVGLIETLLAFGFIAFMFTIYVLMEPNDGSVYWTIMTIATFGLGFIMAIVNTWISLALHVKRYHDVGKSGTWIFISFIPIIGGIWMFVECGFFPGDPGKNHFGPPDPNFKKTR